MAVQTSMARNHQKSLPEYDSNLADNEDAAILATLGYKQELRRNFKAVEVFGLAFSIIGLPSSIASTLTFSIPAGPAGMVWGWFVTCPFIFIIGLAMADLGSAMPTSGGLYWWTCYFAPPAARKPLSFLVGYSNTLGLIGGLCSVDYAFSLMLLSVVVIARDGAWSPSDGIVYAVFLACILCHGVLACVMHRIMGRLQTAFVAMNVVLICATIIALPIGARHKRNDAHFIFAHIDNLTTWPTGFTFVLGWLSPIWTIASFDCCVHISEEAANAQKAVPWGILASIGFSWVFGLAFVIALAACINPDLNSVLQTPFGQPLAQIYYDALGKRGALGFMTLIFLLQFVLGISLTVAASRQTWAFSRDGALPFSSFFRHVSQRFGYLPLRSIWGVVLSGAVLGLLSLIAPAAAQALFSLAVAGLYVAWGLPIFARVMWGQRKFKPGPVYTGDRFSVPIAWTAVVFMIFGICLCMFPVEGPHPNAQNMNYTVVINTAVWFGAIAYYYIDARKWFTGPKITLEMDDLTETQQKAIKEEGLEIHENRSRGDNASTTHNGKASESDIKEFSA